VQTVPIVPQLRGSEVVSMQMKLPVRAGSGARVTPVGHPHAPAEHAPPRPQRMPHPPQLFGSALVLIQAPAQMDCPLGQPHTPAVHTPPVAHRIAHVPQ
jgi:hypothetical protein